MCNVNKIKKLICQCGQHSCIFVQNPSHISVCNCNFKSASTAITFLHSFPTPSSVTAPVFPNMLQCLVLKNLMRLPINQPSHSHISCLSIRMYPSHSVCSVNIKSIHEENIGIVHILSDIYQHLMLFPWPFRFIFPIHLNWEYKVEVEIYKFRGTTLNTAGILSARFFLGQSCRVEIWRPHISFVHFSDLAKCISQILTHVYIQILQLKLCRDSVCLVHRQTAWSRWKEKARLQQS